MMKQGPQTENKNVRHIQLKVPADVYKKFHSACVHEETNMRAKALDLIVEYAEKSKSFFDMEKSEQEHILAEITSEAIEKIHAAGLPTSHGDNKGVYLLYPDGHREYIKTYDKEAPIE
jgi:hypothetical protein